MIDRRNTNRNSSSMYYTNSVRTNTYSTYYKAMEERR